MTKYILYEGKKEEILRAKKIQVYKDLKMALIGVAFYQNVKNVPAFIEEVYED